MEIDEHLSLRMYRNEAESPANAVENMAVLAPGPQNSYSSFSDAY